jgi:hypothetical protein
MRDEELDGDGSEGEEGANEDAKLFTRSEGKRAIGDATEKPAISKHAMRMNEVGRGGGGVPCTCRPLPPPSPLLSSCYPNCSSGTPQDVAVWHWVRQGGHASPIHFRNLACVPHVVLPVCTAQVRGTSHSAGPLSL